MKIEKLKMKNAFFKYNVKLWYPTYRMMYEYYMLPPTDLLMKTLQNK